MLTRRQQGVTLLELMAGLSMLALLLALGMPSFGAWLANTQNRTAAESVLNGLQLARTEAVRRNSEVRFRLTEADGQVSWTVGCVNVTAACPATIQARPAADGSPHARVGVSLASLPSPLPAGHFDAALAAGNELAAGVSFNGLGRVPVANIGSDFTRADITHANNAVARRYVVLVGLGGQVRMCDPKLPFATNPQGCS